MDESSWSFRLQVLARSLAFLAILGAILFGSAGRLDLPFFWAHLAALGTFMLVSLLTLPRGLLEERARPGGPGRDSLAILRGAAIAIFLSEWVTAGLDVGRFHWSRVPLPVQVAALAATLALYAVWFSAMRANPFFSAAMRVQRDRGHRVITSGPYRFVRHPGYAALLLLGWAGPVALGSFWAALPHLGVIAFFVRRAAREDRMLHEELAGYADYARSVPHRVLPGVW